MRASAASLSLLLALGACGPTGAEPEHTWFEGLSLTFSDGSLYASHGTPRFSGEDLDGGAFAVAFPDSVGGWGVGSFLPTGDGRGDLFIVQLTERRTGPFSPCAPDAVCHGRLLEGLDADEPQAGAHRWEIVAGTVHVDATVGGRLTGRFSDLRMRSAQHDGERVVREGGFDVEVLSNAEGVARMTCFVRRLSGERCGAQQVR